MRVLVGCLLTTSIVLSIATGAAGRAVDRDQLTFNEAGLDGHKRILSRHSFFALSESLSPDRRRLVYVPYACETCRRTEVWIADVRSGKDLLLLRAERVGDVAWSPDGRTIAISMQRTTDDPDGIWLITPEGNDLRRGPKDGGGEIAWSPDSRSLAFGFSGANQRSYVGVASAESGATRVLGEGFNPEWSPDGRLLLFRYATGLKQQLRVRVAPSTGGRVRTVAHGDFPTWSPNGRRIAFMRFYDDRYFSSLLVDSIYGGKPRRLATGVGQMKPVWSPDGRRIAFSRVHPSRACHRTYGRCEGLYVVSATGGRPRLLARATRAIEPLAWSRNGSRILYAGIVYPSG